MTNTISHSSKVTKQEKLTTAKIVFFSQTTDRTKTKTSSFSSLSLFFSTNSPVFFPLDLPISLLSVTFGLGSKGKKAYVNSKVLKTKRVYETLMTPVTKSKQSCLSTCITTNMCKAICINLFFELGAGCRGSIEDTGKIENILKCTVVKIEYLDVT